MTKEDILLPVEMGRLEIEPSKPTLPNHSVENPFIISQEKKRSFTHKLTRHVKCNCYSQKKDITVPIHEHRNKRVNKRRYYNGIIKAPTLKLIRNYEGNASLASVRNICVLSTNIKTEYPESMQRDISWRALVDNCNQLTISSDCIGQINEPLEVKSDSKWWKQSIPLESAGKEVSSDKSRAGPSCSQEALNHPCDVTIDELASYFETLVHIPKKMSSMAEMMYI